MAPSIVDVFICIGFACGVMVREPHVTRRLVTTVVGEIFIVWGAPASEPTTITELISLSVVNDMKNESVDLTSVWVGG